MRKFLGWDLYFNIENKKRLDETRKPVVNNDITFDNLKETLLKIENPKVLSRILFYDRSQIIMKSNEKINSEMLGKNIYVYNGKKLEKVEISNKMLGYKLGEFIRTKKLSNNLHPILTQKKFRGKKKKKNKILVKQDIIENLSDEENFSGKKMDDFDDLI